MKVSKGDRCCVCGEQAAERAFDGTAWCSIHFEDWKAFYNYHRQDYDSLDATFRAWLKLALESQEAKG